MSITKELKRDLVVRASNDANNTGSPEAQCIIWTETIKYLNDHLKTHSKDHQSRRGLLTMVIRRRRMLGYLKRKNQCRYHNLVDMLHLKRA